MRNLTMVFLVSSLAALSGCNGGVNVETQSITTGIHGESVYNVHGYTNLGEIQPGAGRKYAKQGGEKCCPNGHKIIRYMDTKMHNAIGEMLYWNASLVCINPERHGEVSKQGS